MTPEDTMVRFAALLIKSAGGKIEVADKTIETFDFEKYEIQMNRDEAKQTVIYSLKEIDESIAHID